MCQRRASLSMAKLCETFAPKDPLHLSKVLVLTFGKTDETNRICENVARAAIVAFLVQCATFFAYASDVFAFFDHLEIL